MRQAVIFKKKQLYYLDQRQLPKKEVYRECRGLKDGFLAIKELRVRGAPLIGVFAAYCAYISLRKFKGKRGEFMPYLDKVVSYLESSRPTAVNLSWALGRIKAVAGKGGYRSIGAREYAILREAQKIHKQDICLCANMAKEGVKLIHRGDKILTHCNTGFLATSGEGTALAVIYAAARKYKNIKIYADETRPLLQGARLTSWELKKSKVDVTLICDDMAAYLMQKKMIDKILVGADRVVRNGDAANKIGTYNLAVVARYHKIPFYMVVPSTSFDLAIENGEGITIEQRKPNEVRKVLGQVWIAPKKVKVYNPSFDVTPHRLITAIITDRGIIYPPFKKNIKEIIA